MRKSFPVPSATAGCVIKFWSDSMCGVTSIAVAVFFTSASRVGGFNERNHNETAANHDRDSADRRKRIGTALRSAVSSGKYASWRKKGTAQHVEHESYHADRSENSTATSR